METLFEKYSRKQKELEELFYNKVSGFIERYVELFKKYGDMEHVIHEFCLKENFLSIIYTGNKYSHRLIIKSKLGFEIRGDFVASCKDDYKPRVVCDKIEELINEIRKLDDELLKEIDI